MAVPFACNRQISWISPHRFDLSNRLETAGSVASSGRAPRSLVDSYQTSASLRGGRSRSIGRKCQVHVTRVNEGCEWDEALSRMLHFPLRAAAKCGCCRKKKRLRVCVCVSVCVCFSLLTFVCACVCGRAASMPSSDRPEAGCCGGCNSTKPCATSESDLRHQQPK